MKNVIIIRTPKEGLAYVGAKATIISTEGNLVFAKVADGTILKMDKDFVLGYEFKEITRAMIADEVRAEIAELKAQFEAKVAVLNADIERLGYESDKAYEDAVFAAKVKAIVKK